MRMRACPSHKQTHLLDAGDEALGELGELNARALPQHRVVLEDEHRLARVVAPQALLPQRDVRARAAALALGHVVQRGDRLPVVEAVELRVPLASHELVGDVVTRLGRKAAGLGALRAQLTLHQLLAVDAFV